MPKPRQILTRRKTVQNIAKITRTMEMISTGRYRKFQDRVARVRRYTDGVSRMVGNVAADASLGIELPLLTEHPEAPRDALIVMASNRGLCGGFNGGVLRTAHQRYRELVAAGQTVDVYAVGKKTHNFMRFRGIQTCWEIPQYERRVDLAEVDTLAAELMDRFIAGELRSVQVVHATFVSTSVQKPTILTLLPLGEIAKALPEATTPGPRKLGPGEYHYMPDPDTILGVLLPRTVSLRLYQTFLDAVLSEQVARMTAMHLANENADEMIRSLTMAYNRARQSTITTELAEIVSGVESMQ